MITLAVTENIQREDLTPLEEGKLFQTMIRDMKLTQVGIATTIKKDRHYVRNRLRLAQAPIDVQEFVASKVGTMNTALCLLEITDSIERALIIQRIKHGSLAADDLPAYIEKMQGKIKQPKVAETPVVEPLPDPTDTTFSASPPPSTPPIEVQISSASTRSKKRTNGAEEKEQHADVAAKIETDRVAVEVVQTNDSDSADAAPVALDGMELVRFQWTRLRSLCEQVEELGRWFNERPATPLPDPEREMMRRLANMLLTMIRNS